SESDVARLFEQRDLISAPVVDDNGKLLGRITIDDVVDVLQERADSSFLGMAGVGPQEDLFAPVLRTARGRTFWLGLNLLTALFASWAIGLFDATIEKMVALAILMPIVASMGGNAASQTLAVTIRGLAMDQVSRRTTRMLLRRELRVGLLNGTLWAVVVALAAGFWFRDTHLGLIIGAAMVINLLCAAAAGFAIPVLLHRSGVDPALASTVFVTTVTDVVGFVAFLGLAALFLV
ncbi:MAG: magnesium transporter, partial [Pseudomonadota bacterium]|nr:magnesium transporter [Pseudomonadota bacterium]